MLKIVSPSISPILCYLLNLSSEQAIYPQCLKETIITPVYKKKGAKNDAGNYRPISVVPVIAKVYENLICNRIVTHLRRNKLLSLQQHGFRSHYSTTTATIKLTTDVYGAMDKRLYTGGLFIDFQSAFNKVIHVLLIRKLKKIGIQGTALKLLESYLADRKIRVKVNGCISKQGKLRVGIPQGGGISSVLFAVFINDLPPCLKETLVIIYYYHKSPKIIQDILNEDLKAIQEWSIKNGMEINWSKTHSMLFQPPKMRGTDDFHISIEDHTIQKVKSFKYLGVVLDEQLTFDDHYDQTCKAVTSRIHLISRHKHSFSHERLIIFSKSLIVSVIDYCIPVWGGICQSKMNRLDYLLDKLIKNILNFKIDIVSCNDRVEIANVLYTEERKVLYGLKFLFQHIIHKTDVTQEFSSYFTLVTSSTRSNGNLAFNYPKTSIGKKSFFYWATQYWNNLPTSIKEIKSSGEFDRALRQLILQKRNDEFVFQKYSL